MAVEWKDGIFRFTYHVVRGTRELDGIKWRCNLISLKIVTAEIERMVFSSKWWLNDQDSGLSFMIVGGHHPWLLMIMILKKHRHDHSDDSSRSHFEHHHHDSWPSSRAAATSDEIVIKLWYSTTVRSSSSPFSSSTGTENHHSSNSSRSWESCGIPSLFDNKTARWTWAIFEDQKTPSQLFLVVPRV